MNHGRNLSNYWETAVEYQTAMNWCEPKLVGTDERKIAGIVCSFNHEMDEFNRLLSAGNNCWQSERPVFWRMDKLIAQALDLIASIRFQDFAIHEVWQGVKSPEKKLEVRDRFRHDLCRDLNDHLREIFAYPVRGEEFS